MVSNSKTIASRLSKKDLLKEPEQHLDIIASSTTVSIPFNMNSNNTSSLVLIYAFIKLGRVRGVVRIPRIRREDGRVF